MQVKVNELSGNALDWAVAKCEGIELIGGRYNRLLVDGHMSRGQEMMAHYKPSTEWEQGGVIIEREGIALLKRPMGYWVASLDRTCEGDAPLIASMRCYVASKLGDEVDIPDELFEGAEQ